MSAFPHSRWLLVYLWCSRAEAAARLAARGAVDIAERLRAWDETIPPSGPDIAVDTGSTPPLVVAHAIDQAVKAEVHTGTR
jgi:guanylate kinase